MSIKIMKMKLNNLSNFLNNELEIDFFAEKRVYEDEKESFVVSKLFNNSYKLNTIAFVGKNATGKTTVLNIISDILKIYIQNKSITEVKKLGSYFDSTLEIENIITDGEKIFKIKSVIKKDDMGTLYFHEEDLFVKNEISNMAKKDSCIFSNDDSVLRRSNMKNEFLKDEDSIFSSILNTIPVVKMPYVKDMMRFTNFNFLGFVTAEIPLSFVNYLDPSIETFKIILDDIKLDNKEDKGLKFAIKFKDSEKEFKVDIENLETYLSSGTIKGLTILFNAMIILKFGGYLLIDEIENHLNKSIVINLINLFTSTLNQKGATLIFTTHYSEILDSMDRSDSIYVMNKTEKIFMNKFSKLANNKDRQDKKKSDLMLSGVLDTSPSYFDYMKLKEDLKTRVERSENK